MSYKVPNQSNQQSINHDAIYNLYMYLDIEAKDQDGDGLVTFKEALKTADKQGFNGDKKRNLDALHQLVDDNDYYNDVEIRCQNIPSKEDPTAVGAVCFYKESENSMTITFRGTNDGEWYGNAETICLPDSTEAQKNAVAYFDKVIEEECLGHDMTINVTGHSNGGNKTATVLLESKYGGIINQAVSFDGEGFSRERIAGLKNNLGTKEYNNRINKLIGVNGENDFVNELGERVVSSDNNFYVTTLTSNDEFNPGGYHDIYYMFIAGYDKNGKPILKENLQYTEQKEVGKLVSRINKKLMKLPMAERLQAAYTIMALMEVSGDIKYNGLYGDYNIFNVICHDLPGFITHGGPILVYNLLLTEEGHNFIIEYFDDLIEAFKESPVLVSVVAVAMVAVIAVIECNWVYIVLWDEIVHIMDYVKEISQQFKDFLVQSFEVVMNAINNGINWVNNNLNPGYIYATNHPYIEVNTNMLRSYAKRIQSVNGRLGILDQRINGLYLKVGLQDLHSLLISDLKVGYSFALKANMNYLNDVADDFEKTENKIRNM